MTIDPEEENLQTLRRERIARTKRFLRKLPRRTNIHRYPVLKWFAASARKRSYLWSFRVQAVTPALYAGFILAFLPLYGIQLILSFVLSLIFRANLAVVVALQFITNPLTVIPIYFTAFQIGRLFLRLFGLEGPHLNMTQARALFSGIHQGDWGSNLQFFFSVIGLTSLGALMMGIFCAAIANVVYKATAREVTLSYQRLKELQARREAVARSAQENHTENH
ncbi:MAG: DUF2062 domain-containing protein [Opitutales bacterium]|nr:DUF2062 domain-containing protein [Opitutales bacterium]